MTDVIIVGGGLAGLVNAILLARGGLSVVLLEKKYYPFHRVCGEYISNEVVPFLKKHDIYPHELGLPLINKLTLTSTRGRKADLDLDLGGFGISRFQFDHYLYKKAVKAGVSCHLRANVIDIDYSDEIFTVRTSSKQFQSKIVIGAFGKRSILDRRLDRSFMKSKSPYIGVKYHVRTDFPSDRIALHNFLNGYCGISQVENEVHNLCYLSHRKNLAGVEDLMQMEKTVLYQNPFLKDIFENSEFLFEKPIVINEISFAKKLPVENHIFMSGDSAGMITPLCGNGMAMAIHSSKILSEIILKYWNNGDLIRSQMEMEYWKEWNKLFAFRLWAGRKIQSLFGSHFSSQLAIGLAKNGIISNALISLTHGKEF